MSAGQLSPLKVNVKSNCVLGCSGVEKKVEQGSSTVNQAASAEIKVRIVAAVTACGGITKELTALRSYRNG